MTNYFETLKIHPKASQNRIFRRFRKLYLKHQGDAERQKELFIAYLVLLDNCSKFYRIVLKQEKRGIRPTEKYVQVVNRRIERASSLYDQREYDITKNLNSFPKGEISKSAASLFFGVDLTWTFVIAVLFIFGCVALVSTLNDFEWLTFYLSLQSFLLCYQAYIYGYGKIRKEAFDEMLGIDT